MTFTLSGELVLTIIINVALIAVAWGTMRAQVAGLVDKSKDQDTLSTSLTELRVEVKHLQEALTKQPAMIAQVVAATIKETARLLQPIGARQ